jgi:hypothetical protein
MYTFARVIYTLYKKTNQWLNSQISVYQYVCLYKIWARCFLESVAGVSKLVWRCWSHPFCLYISVLIFYRTYWFNLSHGLYLLTISARATNYKRLKWWKLFTDVLYTTRISRRDIWSRKWLEKCVFCGRIVYRNNRFDSFEQRLCFSPSVCRAELEWILLFNANAVGTLQQLTCVLTEVYSGCRLFRVSYRLFSSQLL